MTRAQARLLRDGNRLHLQHGPIDLVIGADGARDSAFAAAQRRFTTVLGELVSELPLLRRKLTPDSPLPDGAVARRMYHAAQPHCAQFLTPMAAVAGSVADEVLDAMVRAAPLSRAYVNNGGDIALHLGAGASFTAAMQDHDGRELGRVSICQGDGVGGMASSGRHGRSLSMGIADSVTVLASTAAAADAAATLIANAVDLAEHFAIARCPAQELDPDSDLGQRPVVTSCGPLSAHDIAQALDAGLHCASTLQRGGQIIAASLSLQGQTVTVGPHLTSPKRSLQHA